YHMQWRGTTGPAMAVQFHRGHPDTGAVVHTLSFPAGDSMAIGTWEGVTTADLKLIASESLSFNITTATNPKGEVFGFFRPIEAFTAAIEPPNEVPPLNLSGPTGTGLLALVGSPASGMFVSI